jgi:L-idonate 5-dehydrogenase
METRVCRLYDIHDLRIEADRVAGPGPGQVLVAVGAGGICGSDLHYYHDGGFGTVRIKEPITLGHEVAGVVEAVGADVAGVRVGDRVAVNPSLACGTCEYCRRGEQLHCLDMRFFGSAMRFPHVQGAFSEYVKVDRSQCFKVLGTLTAGEAAMAEPLAVCLHAVNQAGSLVGAKVLITGSGPIGALCAAAARRAGATEIVATDVAALPLKTMERVGADRAIDIGADPDGLKPYGANKGTFDVLFEASGKEAALTGALDALRPQARIVQVGLGGDITLPMTTVVTKEFTIRGTFRFFKEFGTAVEMMNKGLIDVTPLISQTMPFRQAQAAFDLAGDRRQAMKVQLAFS